MHTHTHKGRYINLPSVRGWACVGPSEIEWLFSSAHKIVKRAMASALLKLQQRGVGGVGDGGEEDVRVGGEAAAGDLPKHVHLLALSVVRGDIVEVHKVGGLRDGEEAAVGAVAQRPHRPDLTHQRPKRTLQVAQVPQPGGHVLAARGKHAAVRVPRRRERVVEVAAKGGRHFAAVRVREHRLRVVAHDAHEVRVGGAGGGIVDGPREAKVAHRLEALRVDDADLGVVVGGHDARTSGDRVKDLHRVGDAVDVVGHPPAESHVVVFAAKVFGDQLPIKAAHHQQTVLDGLRAHLNVAQTRSGPTTARTRQVQHWGGLSREGAVVSDAVAKVDVHVMIGCCAQQVA
mmetsp:Transcript_16218/g.28853  ORF Transcript_16218/g.28853 Transcript_16218/m.28853 type:complete len:345 (+) Transcript_16218:386-1420(+)